jgi:hypothetical protein
LQIDGDRTMAKPGELVGQPTVAGSKIKDGQRATGNIPQHWQNLPFDVAIRARANRPLPGVASRAVPKWQRPVELRVVTSPPFRLANKLVIMKKALVIGLPFRRKCQPDAVLLRQDCTATDACDGGGRLGEGIVMNGTKIGAANRAT